MKALDTSDVDAILPFVPEKGEAEIMEAFDRQARLINTLWVPR